MFSICLRDATMNRRELLCVGGLTALGLGTADLARLQAQSAEQSPATKQRAKSVVFVFLFGGPSHIDLWDMKPKAAVEIRGEFNPAATNVPGIQLCEHLPHMAKQMDKIALLRSMTHKMPVHGPACSEMYSGRSYFGPPTTDQATPEDWPSISSLVMRYGKSLSQLPPSVVLPLYSHFIGQSKRIAGQTGGRMGDTYNPVLIQGEPGKVDFEVSGFNLLEGVGVDRLELRRSLLHQLEANSRRATDSFGTEAKKLADHSEMAYSMLQQQSFRRGLDLQRTPLKHRERYGMTNFGQSLLLAKQLVEEGVSLITVNYDDKSKYDKRSPMWDTHHDNFSKLKKELCPNFDKAFAAFIEDLHQSGLLESTMVVVTGEFGRTPHVGQFSQNAMTLKTGRDHWPYAFTVLLAGGGVRGGQVYGSTIANGGFVDSHPVTPADLAATILTHLGIDTSQQYDDYIQDVHHSICEGTPIPNLG